MTEPEYLRYVAAHLRDALIEVRTLGSLGDPVGVVSRAINEKRDADARSRGEKDPNAAYDQVWCLMDVDQHARLAEALAMAQQADVRVALSNPCFEIWPVLHFVRYGKPCTTGGISAELARHMPGYEKSLDCDRLQGSFTVARGRAQQLDATHRDNGAVLAGGLGNPATSVWRLVDELVAAATDANPALTCRL